MLTVVASESYRDFVTALQKDISATLSDRPRVADKAYFQGKVIKTSVGDLRLSDEQAGDIEFYLIQNGYVDKKRHITDKYHQARKDGAVAELPEELAPHAEQVFALIDSVFSDAQMPQPDDGRKAKKLLPNANFHKKEFQALWQRINHKAAYTVQFDSVELVAKAAAAINHKDTGLRVVPLQYVVQAGEQAAHVSDVDVKSGKSFVLRTSATDRLAQGAVSAVRYDLVGKLAEGTQLTRRTVADILQAMNAAVFAQFRSNPESFIAQAIRLINEQKATMVVEHLAYDTLQEKFDSSIFTADQTLQDLSQAGAKLRKHVYDHVITQSKVERDFVEQLDLEQNDVVVYAKLPRGFFISTPVGDYNPEWAIAFQEGKVRHVYFVAETKGSLSSLALRPIEATKIECARKFFEAVNQRFDPENVRYDVVDSFERLTELVL